MATLVLLTAEQADQVRGLSAISPHAALNPVGHHGGMFVLGADVLTDPAHEAHRVFLASLPRIDGADPEFSPGVGEQDE